MKNLDDGPSLAQPKGMARRAILAGLTGIAAAFTPRALRAQTTPEDYASPYSLTFSVPMALLNAGFDRAPWNDPDAESQQDAAAWEAANAGHRGAAWGPPARQYPAPALPRTDEDYQRQRVISVAARHIGLAYQHHHVPSWEPRAGWPWIAVDAGANGPGLDCSNFSSFAFNYALGLKLPTGIGVQGRATDLPGPGGHGRLRAERIDVGRYDDLRTALAPADLLYVRNRHDRVSHVVMWLGDVGHSSDGTPLILDCTQTAHRDAAGVMIPSGVRLRPFREQGWYWRQFSHAHRLIGGDATTDAGVARALVEGDDRA